MTKISLFFMFSLFSIGSMQSAEPEMAKVNFLLLWASKNNNISLVQDMLNKNANVNTIDTFGETPLCNAISNGNEDMVNLLLKAKANPNANPPTERALSILMRTIPCQHTRHRILKSLFSAGATTESSINNHPAPLFWAAKQQYTTDCKILLQAGAQIPNNLYPFLTEWLDKVITELNAENRKNAELIQEFLALQPAGTILPVMDALYVELDTKQYPLASEVYAARKIQRAGRGMQTRKNPKKIIQENL